MERLSDKSVFFTKKIPHNNLAITNGFTQTLNYQPMWAMNNSILKKILVGSLLFFTTAKATFLQAQDAQPDLADATILCDKRPVTITTFAGAGTDASEGAGTCMDGITETNTTWFTWEGATFGNLSFTITPTNPNDRIAFVLFDLPDGSDPVALRCGAACFTGSTGLVENDNDAVINCQDSPTDGFARALSMEQGLTYGLLIENTTSDGGFTITFGGDGELVGPVGQIMPSATEACFGQTLTFDEDITFDNGDVIRYDWLFEDGDDNQTVTTQEKLPQSFDFATTGTKRIELMVTTSTGCNALFETFITINDCCQTDNRIAIANDPVVTEIACPDDTNGAIDITVINDSNFPTIFEWSNGADTEDLMGLGPDTYMVTISNAAGCRDSLTHTFVIPNALTAMETVVAPSCGGLSDGSITIDASGGRTPYAYDFGDGNGFVPTATLNGLDTGDYTVIVQDDSGCTTTLEAIELDERALNITTDNLTNPSCGNLTDGSIEINADNAIGVLTFDFNDGNGPLDPTSLARLDSGTYIIDVFDSEGCTGNPVEFTLTKPEPINGLIEARRSSCNGANDGTAIITVSGGVPDFTYEWSNGATTRSIGNLAPGTYMVTVTDANGCTFEGTSSPIIDPPVLTASVASVQDVSCSDQTNGVIELTVEGGITPYKYSTDGINFEAGTTIENLAIGDYEITVTDNNDCPVNLSATISSPATISFDVSTTANICYGEPITFTNTSTFTQGTIISVAWEFGNETVMGNEATTSFTTIGNPTVTLIVETDLGCIERLTRELDIAVEPCCDQDNGVSFLPIFEEPFCNGSADGSITLNSFSLPPITNINWDNGANTEIIEDLPAGTYTVVVTNDATCEGTTSITLEEPTPITTNLDLTNPTCEVAGNGAISVTATGGTLDPGNTYEYDFGNGFSTNNTLENLAFGGFSIMIRDDNNCVVTVDTDLMVSETPPISASLDLLSPTCDVASNGAITVTATGIGANPTLVYDFGNGFSPDDATTSLVEGSYSIRIQDENNCILSIDTNLVASDIPPIMASLDLEAPTCEAALNGAITILTNGSGSGVGGDFLYDFGNGFSPNATAENLPTGNYSIQIQDGDNCVLTIDTILEASPNPPITATLNVESPTCDAALNGSITVAAIGEGGSTLMYDFGDGFSASSIAENLTAGDYSIQIQDQDNCVLVINRALEVSEVPPITANIAINRPSCEVATNGSITINAIGNNDLVYDFGDGFSTQNTADNLIVGTYTVVIQDRDNCTLSIDTALTVDPDFVAITATFTNIIQPSCGGGTDGAITVIPAGELGSDIANYTFDFGNGTLDNNTSSNLSAGPQLVVVRNANNCSFTLDTVLNEPVLEPTFIVARPTCFGLSDGSIIVDVPTPGQGPYTYDFGDGNGFQSADVLTDLPQGNYGIQVQDANLCLSGLLDVLIDQPDELMLTIAPTDISCFGENDGRIVAEVTGGVGNYTYNWSDGQTTNIASNLGAGEYLLDVTDGNDCPIISNLIPIIEPAELTVEVGQIQDVLCFGETNGAISINANGGSAPFEYSLDGIIFQPTPTLNDLPAGDYTVIVKDSRACEVPTSNITVAEPEEFIVTAAVDDPVTKLGFTINLSAETSTNNGGINFVWATPDSIVCNNCQNYATVPPGSTIYTVTAVNSDNCQSTASVSVAVSLDRPVYIPNIFSPNGDGINDEFYIPFSPAMKEITELKIFDRTGALIYEAFNIVKGEEILKAWDGEFAGSKLRQGVFVISAQISFVDDQILPYQSDVTLITSE